MAVVSLGSVPAAATAGGEAATAAVLQCTGPPYASGILEGGEAGGSTPEEAVTAFPRGPARPLPVHGFRPLQRSRDAVLFVYRHNGGVRAAIRVERDAKTMDGSAPPDPWTFTSFAMCDPSEYAPSADDETGIRLVRRTDGTRLPARLAHLTPLMPHCWPGAWILELGRSLPTFVRDPQNTLAGETLVPYEADAALPVTAVDSGLRTDAFALYTDSDTRAIYAVGLGHVERWPALRPALRSCA